jgi:hypothetical protein
LRCGHCGSDTPIPTGSGAVPERDLHTVIESQERAAAAIACRTLPCPGCGAQVTLAADRTSAPCPWCGGALAATDAATTIRRPDGVLPFAVERPRAQAALAAWVRSRWFAPTAFVAIAGPERLRPVWLPAWTVDAATRSAYTGERGDDYRVQETRQVMEQGKMVTKQVTVTRTRWTSVSGTVTRSFDDILVPAPRTLPTDRARALEPWPLDRLVPFDDAFLAGTETETPGLAASAAFVQARAVMDAAIRSDVTAAIGGDHQRIHGIDTGIHDPTTKQVLLPVWAAGYRHRGKTYTVLVNAVTGEVQGERPWSAAKIILTVAVIGAAAAAVIAAYAAAAAPG